MRDWEIEATEIREMQPKHILFLCVANSARSQLAEGIARSMAPVAVRISSAGSNPSAVNPLAIQALREIGLDISSHVSKSVEHIDSSDVEVVITLCMEEVCPVFLGKAVKFHWGMPDPAAGGMDEFRAVRDELMNRLKQVFGT